MSVGPFQILIVVLVILVLFGRGRISDMMGDFGKGIKSFRQGLSETERQLQAPGAELPVVAAEPIDKTTR